MTKDKNQLVPKSWEEKIMEKGQTEHDLKHTTSCASGTGFLLFIDDGTADKSSRMDSEVHSVILSASSQLNASKLIGWCFTLQIDNDLKCTSKATLNKKGCISYTVHPVWI